MHAANLRFVRYLPDEQRFIQLTNKTLSIEELFDTFHSLPRSPP